MLIDYRLAQRTDAPHTHWGRQKVGWKSHAWVWVRDHWVARCGMHPVDAQGGSLHTTLEMQSEGPVCATCEHRDNEAWNTWWDTHAQTGE